MKKNIIYILLILVSFSGQTTRAEETGETPTRQSIMRERIEKQKESFAQNLEEAKLLREQYKAEKNPEQKELIRKEARNGFMVRLTNATKKLGELQDKINQKIIETKEKGLPVEEAEKKMTASKEYLKIVTSEQEKLSVLLAKETVTRGEVQQSFNIIKENLSLARKELIASMQILKQVVVESLKSDDATDDENTDEQENEEETENTDDTNNQS